jgi:hypothetical protein
MARSFTKSLHCNELHGSDVLSGKLLTKKHLHPRTG